MARQRSKSPMSAMRSKSPGRMIRRLSNKGSGSSPTSVSVSCANRACPSESLPKFINDRDWSSCMARLQFREGKKEVKQSGGALLRRALDRGAPPDVSLAILKAFPDAAKSSDRYNKLPIHYACQVVAPSAELIQELLALFPEGAAMENIHGDLPIHLACRSFCFMEVLHALLIAFPAGIAKQNKLGEFPLHSVLTNGYNTLPVVKTVLYAYPEAAKTAQKETGEMPLHLACKKGFDMGIVWALLRVYPQAATVADVDGNFALHAACLDNTFLSVPVLEALLEEYPLACQRVNKKGFLPIHLATQQLGEGRLANVQALLHTFPGGAKQVDVQGRLALHHASIGSHSVEDAAQVVEALVASYPGGAKIRDHSGDLPLHHACVSGVEEDAAEDASNLIPPSMDVVRVLLGVHPQGAFQVDSGGNYPMDTAMSGGGPPHVWKKVVRTFLDANPDAARVPSRDEMTWSMRFIRRTGYGRN